MSTAVSDLWFAGRGASHDAGVTLFCLAHAGSGASAFYGWAEELAPHVEVLPLQLPGRERRIRETLVIDQREVAAAISRAIGARGARPYGFYGHSLGAWLAFEVIRELRQLGLPPPVRFYAGATGPPDSGLPDMLRGLSTAPDDEVVERLLRLGGMPPEVFTDPDLRGLVLEILRCDFGWLDNYVYQPQPPLAVPVVGFAGSTDQIATAAELAAWASHTSAGLTVRQMPGGHFFVQDQRDELISFIRADLSCTT